MEVERAEGAGALTKGTHSIPTAKMSTVKVTSYKGKAKVVVALITGGVGGLMGLGFFYAAGFSQRGSNAVYGYSAAAVLIPIGSVVGSYYLGKSLDKRELTVVVLR